MCERLFLSSSIAKQRFGYGEELRLESAGSRCSSDFSEFQERIICCVFCLCFWFGFLLIVFLIDLKMYVFPDLSSC